MRKIALVFPGQGSQKVGMGSDLQFIPNAQTKFEIAEKVLGWSILDICQEDITTLSQTIYTQPCLYVIESILVDLLQENIGSPEFLTGHSLGEYVALYAAGVFDFELGLILVKKRAELMNKVINGKMVALMNFNRSILDVLIAANPDVILANDNADAQVVISGKSDTVDKILSLVKPELSVKLNVSGAFHSPLMNEASQEFQSVLSQIDFAHAKVPVLSNVEPTPTTDKEQLKERLLKQMTSSVRWREIMLQLSQEGITNIIEVGPNKVLTKLIKRACRNIKLNNVSTAEQLKQFPGCL